MIEADVLLHVRDVSHGDTRGAGRGCRRACCANSASRPAADRIIEVWNKADLLDEDERTRLAQPQRAAGRSDRDSDAPVLVSAVTGEGLAALTARIEARIARHRSTFAVVLPPEDGGALHWLYENAEVLDRREEEGGTMHLAIRIAPEKEPRFLNRFDGRAPPQPGELTTATLPLGVARRQRWTLPAILHDDRGRFSVRRAKGP